MSTKELFFIIMIAVGTYFLRYFPLKISLLKSKSYEGDTSTGVFSELMEVCGVSVIASLLVSSIGVEKGGVEFLYFIRVILASTAVVLSSYFWKNPGISVICGIVSFALLGIVL